MILRRLQSCRLQLRFSSEKKELTAKEKERLRTVIPTLNVQKTESKVENWTKRGDIIDEETKAFDEIRARGFMKVKRAYVPEGDCQSFISKLGQQHSLTGESEISSLKVKLELLNEIGQKYAYFVPNSQLHRIRTLNDVANFYNTPKDNVTTYTKLARDENKPENLEIRENPVRFHPEDKHAFHKGVTAFPGEGGKVISLRNKRIYRQYRPKKEWFDYEEQTFDHEPVDKDCPWDPEVVAKMDTYTDRKLIGRYFRRI
ncbi:unnamed protein product [Bursaphelenchus okinawaensis]|uniref:Large ribosomal subunit protein mL50 n=1 Tax=Bursaphelenchus okinawaensis TaxID=465554 RepID=A0A811K8Z8_9BILA|nr:unnamed protein product [Bursaphelenchus okinawaensis]CAG9095366.1 unnamed protein product [Bursaphelenchus okinawaensis]